jgi:rod shape-determining protein MreD
MVSPYLAAAWLILIATLQTSAMPWLRVAGVVPDVMLLVVISASLLLGSRSGFIWALAGGMLLDLLSGGPTAAASISLAVAALAIGLLRSNLPQDMSWMPLASSALGTAVYQVSYWVILQLAGHPSPWLPSLLQVILPGIMANSLLAYPTFWTMRRVFGHSAG